MFKDLFKGLRKRSFERAPWLLLCLLGLFTAGPAAAADYPVRAIKMVVPYKGTGPALTDLLGGRIDMMFSPSTTVQALIDGGKLKAIAETGAKRSKFFPKLPTVAKWRTLVQEQGITIPGAKK